MFGFPHFGVRCGGNWSVENVVVGGDVGLPEDAWYATAESLDDARAARGDIRSPALSDARTARGDVCSGQAENPSTGQLGSQVQSRQRSGSHHTGILMPNSEPRSRSSRLRAEALLSVERVELLTASEDLFGKNFAAAVAASAVNSDTASLTSSPYLEDAIPVDAFPVEAAAELDPDLFIRSVFDAWYELQRGMAIFSQSQSSALRCTRQSGGRSSSTLTRRCADGKWAFGRRSATEPDRSRSVSSDFNRAMLGSHIFAGAALVVVGRSDSRPNILGNPLIA
mmetsp:Transcript_58146/g.133067  ORF Transcript_58146/g.133067 Transcript_58146/m.133067 type:complete len:282 (+) Transcript_58146:231-1076(+)